jgi:hypothetical protein
MTGPCHLSCRGTWGQRGTRHLHSNVRLLSTFRRCEKSFVFALGSTALAKSRMEQAERDRRNQISLP